MFCADRGDLVLKDEAGRVKTDLEILMASVGARQELMTQRWIGLVLKSEAFLTVLYPGSKPSSPKMAGNAQRLRLMLEGRSAWALSEESDLTPSFETGGRLDGSKAETGVGAEPGGRLGYLYTKLGVRR